MAIDVPRILRRVLARKPWLWRSARLYAAADAQRRGRQFGEAAARYEAYLQARPDHAMGWVMLGHCLLELGRIPAADAAYARAHRLDPRDPYVLFARGVFLKHHGQRDQARALLAASHAIDGGAEAQRELRSLEQPGGGDGATDADAGGARFFIDVSDLLEYAAGNRNLSGIQRVQAALMAHALQHPGDAICVMTRAWDARLWSLSRTDQAALLALLHAGQGGTPEAHAVLQRLAATARMVPPVAGGCYLQAGAFWMGGGNPPLHMALRMGGMRVCVLIHDIIPVTMPQVFVPALVLEFTAALGEVLLGVDGFLANSEHTAATLRVLIARNGLPGRSVLVTPLAHMAREDVGASAEWGAAIAALRGRRFALSVGTIEARKNHVLLVRAWQAMLDAGEDPPLLVLVGKRGWRTDDFDAAMRETHGADGRVLQLNEVSDAELETLYAGCVVSLFPSLSEGWGLPIGESLARGRICVASNRASMPEVGGEHAFYLDPLDVDAAAAMLARLFRDPALLARAQAGLRDGFTPRRWPAVAASMMAALERVPARGAEPAAGAPALPVAMEFRPETSAILGPPRIDPLRHPLRSAFADGWERPRDDGVLMGGHSSRLHFRATTSGRLALEMASRRDALLQLGPLRLPLPAGQPATVTMDIAAGPHSLDLTAEGEVRLLSLRFDTLADDKSG